MSAGVMIIGINEYICARDADIIIDGKKVFQAQKLEIKKSSGLRPVRSCFQTETAAYVRTQPVYRATLTGIRFKKPFENCNFADLDNFTLSARADGRAVTLYGCMWEDFLAAADKSSFSERISARAVRMETEDQE